MISTLYAFGRDGVIRRFEVYSEIESSGLLLWEPPQEVKDDPDWYFNDSTTVIERPHGFMTRRGYRYETAEAWADGCWRNWFFEPSPAQRDAARALFCAKLDAGTWPVS